MIIGKREREREREKSSKVSSDKDYTPESCKIELFESEKVSSHKIICGSGLTVCELLKAVKA